ncbi:MAG TPA: GAF domain-containing SpoIIE family protein phosphatase, partial [candidate division Zixibacteria bacterium]|nr:GAF domain-containing SpoIIE family protein phosphatase [candidate division Zixibacteria bacterium]
GHLMVEHVFFALYDDRVQEYAILPSEAYAIKHIIARNDIYLGAIGQLQRPAPVEELADFAEDSRLAQELQERSARLIFPLRDADRLLGFIILTGKVSGAKYSAEEMNLLQVLSNQLVGALTNARLYAETIEKRRLEEEVAMARQIQIGLLPRSLPGGDCFALAAHSVTSRTVGGDFYDVIKLDDERYCLVIADASGKGMPAAMVITQIQAMIRSELNNNVGIQRALANVNNYLVSLTSAEKYATLCLGIFNSADNSFEYVNAGHNYPALIRRDGSIERLAVGGMIVGAFPGAQYESATVTLNSEEFIFFFTDGISETMNEAEEEYGEDRLIDFLRSLADKSLAPDDIIERTLEDVDRFFKEDPPADDRTIIVLKATHDTVAAP